MMAAAKASHGLLERQAMVTQDVRCAVRHACVLLMQCRVCVMGLVVLSCTRCTSVVLAADLLFILLYIGHICCDACTAPCLQ
jgi:hypothetical protein